MGFAKEGDCALETVVAYVAPGADCVAYNVDFEGWHFAFVLVFYKFSFWDLV